MNRFIVSAILFSCASTVVMNAQDAPAAAGNQKAEPAKGDDKEPAKDAPKKEGPSLPADVLNFYGKVTGTVESVDASKYELKVKVASAEADSEKNKAPKPEALAGMTITVTPLAKKQDDDTVKVDEASVAYIKGAKAGDAVTLNVRASSKGVVFRLLKVPAAAAK